MEYMLHIKENTVFGFSQGPMRNSNGYVEYFDTANPFGLLKLNFTMMSTNPKELNLIPVGNIEDFTKKACNTAIDTFEEIEKKLLDKGILPKTVVVTGITFFSNYALNIQEQLYHYYIYPDKPRSYCVRVPRGLTKNLFRGDNVERPRIPYEEHQKLKAAGAAQRQQHSQQTQNQQQNKKQPHKHKPRQQPALVVTPPVIVGEDDLIDKAINSIVETFKEVPLSSNHIERGEAQLERAMNQAKENLPPISDEVIGNAVEKLDTTSEDIPKEEPKVTYTTDTGISEDFSETDYKAAVAAGDQTEDGSGQEVQPDAVANG